MKLVLRFIIGDIIGNVIVGFFLSAHGDYLSSVCKGLSLWIPMSVVYGAATIIILKRLGIAQLTGMMEICGLGIGLFPPFFGLWPPYMWIWQLAVLLVVMQCVSISFIAFVIWIVYRLRTK
jgi:hypothetical protein